MCFTKLDDQVARALGEHEAEGAEEVAVTQRVVRSVLKEVCLQQRLIKSCRGTRSALVRAMALMLGMPATARRRILTTRTSIRQRARTCIIIKDGGGGLKVGWVSQNMIC